MPQTRRPKKASIVRPDNVPPPWREVVRAALVRLGRESSLQDLYAEIERSVPARLSLHWKAKIRQVVQIYDDFERVEAGVWRLTSTRSRAKQNPKAE